MSTYWDCVRQGIPLTDMDIVDLHGHLGRCTVPANDVTLATQIHTMDRLGVACAVLSHTQCISWDVVPGNEIVWQAMQAFPGRILGYISLWPGSHDTVRSETELRLKQGFVGIKLHNSNGFRYTDAGYEPAFAIANERKLPVLLHTWGSLYGEPIFDDVRTLALRYPDIAFLLAHAGVCSEDKYIAIALELPNVYLDPTMSRTPRGLWERLVAAVGAEKLTWGSDASFFSMTPHLGKVAGAKISEDAKRLILGGNARRLLSRAQLK